MESTKRTVLVTGACAGGIGHAIAVAFARLGHRVAITSKDDLGSMAEVLREMGQVAPAGVQADGHFLALEVDFLNEQQRDQLIAKVVDKFGQLDVLVNNAGTMGNNLGLMDEAFFEEYRTVMQVNLEAPTRFAQLAAPHLLKSTCLGGGVIINISSIASRIPVESFAYAISKAGLNMLTQQLANSFEGKNLRVLTVCLGPILTNMTLTRENIGKLSTLTRRCGTPEEVARVVVFLASEQASFMTGATVDVDGGMACKAGRLLTDACIQGCLPPGVTLAQAKSQIMRGGGGGGE